MRDIETQEVLRRPRGRPRKNPESLPGEVQKRGSQTSHGPEHYAEIRYKRSLARIIHKQFRILREDEAEAERLMSALLKKANAAYRKVSDDSSEAHPAEPDPLDDPEPVAVSQEPPTASLLEIEAVPVPEPAGKPKAIRERGKLTLKAFRKEPQ